MILVVAEHASARLSKSTLELIATARNAGRRRAPSRCSLLVGSGLDEIATEAASFVEQVLVADLPELAAYDAEVWAAAVAQIAYEGESKVCSYQWQP